ncbi:MAG: EfeM/EfeO family lipoprotein [Phycisphaerales bacterium]
MLRATAAGGLGLLLAGGSAQGRRSFRDPEAGSAGGGGGGGGASRGVRALAPAVAEGIGYFRRQCAAQLPLVEEMVRAIASRDLEGAKRAYIEARPRYEQIEVLANCFVDSDRDIDARPYAFEGGEEDPEFRGFHKVEALVFAYEDLDAALPFARELVASVRRLGEELAQAERFAADLSFDGMVMLATEVPAKKISSEEETWSDQSLLIFRHNWEGIWSQFAPMVDAANAARAGAGDGVREAYEKAMALLDGHFTSGSAAGTPYSKIGIAERRRMGDTSLRLRGALLAARESLGV